MSIKMDYNESLEYLRNIEEVHGMDFSILETVTLSEKMGRPERRLKIIHIAGTNGKGSVSDMICHMLAMSGYLVGRYTSPAVFSYRERIQKLSRQGDEIACVDASEEEIAEKITALKDISEKMKEEGDKQPTVFEIETVMAFSILADWGVDVAVIETGLGGRMDATNIIEHTVQCVFTSISMEHQKFLGDTVEKIAREKFGIIKKNAQIISFSDTPSFDVLEDQAKRKKADIFTVAKSEITDVSYEPDRTSFSYKGEDYVIRNLGAYQPENAALAIESVLHLKDAGFEKISGELMKKGLEKSFWHGRFEVLSREPFVLVDGAHNPDAVERLVESLEKYFPGETFEFIFGALSDKDYRREISILLPYAERIYTVTAPSERGISADTLEDAIVRTWEAQGRKLPVSACASIWEAMDMSIENAGGKRIVVCGSLTLISEAYAYMKQGKDQ